MAGCQSGGNRPASDADRPTQGGQDAPPQDLITSRIIAPGAYSGEGGVFDLARDVLREEGFILDRVDAAAGVITTRAKTTAGIATPWDSEQSSAEQELDDLANRQQRTVRITFEPARAVDHAGTTETFDETGAADLRQGTLGVEGATGEVRMSVRVVVERLQRPGWRVNPVSVRLSTYCIDTDLQQRGLSYQFAVARGEDIELARRLADEIVLRRHRSEHATP